MAEIVRPFARLSPLSNLMTVRWLAPASRANAICDQPSSFRANLTCSPVITARSLSLNSMAPNQPLGLEGTLQSPLGRGEIVVSRPRLARRHERIYSLLPVCFLLMALRQRQDDFARVMKSDEATAAQVAWCCSPFFL
jgi:hypothetical protein